MILNTPNLPADHVPLVDQEEVVRSLTSIVEPNQVIEVRALDAKTERDFSPATYSGYFEASNLVGLATATMTLTQASGIYFVVNPVDPALLARSVNKLRRCGKGDPTTTDDSILRRRYLLVDLDPQRPAKVSSSDDEHEAALERAARVADGLAEDGWPNPILADSGNGAHLLYPIDEPTEDGGLIKAVLAALNNRFGDAHVSVDRTVHNPARIWKMYGSRACKGDPDAAQLGRPQRMSRVLSVPEVRAIVTHRQLVDLVDKYGDKPSPSKTMATIATVSQSGKRFDIETWIKAHEVNVNEPKSYEGGRKWEFNVCPFNSDHNNKSAAILQFANGAIVFKCHHNGCVGNDWHALRALVEQERQPNLCQLGVDKVVESATDTPEPCKLITARELIARNPKLRDVVLKGLLRRGETMNVIAASKQGKSWFVLSLLFALATGRPWLGVFEVARRGRVLLIDNELHPETIVFRLATVGAALGLNPDQWVDMIDVMPLRGALVDLRTLDRLLAKVEPNRYALVVLDAWYRALPTGTDENSNGTIAELYNRIDKIADRLGCSWVNIHHASKGSQTSKSVVDVGSGAGSQSRAADVHLVLRQHEEAGAVVLDAAVRSWPPIEPRCLRFTFPLWTSDDALDPRRLRPERSRQKKDKGGTVPDSPKREPLKWTSERVAVELVGPSGLKLATLQARANEVGLSMREAKSLLESAVDDRFVEKRRVGKGGNAPVIYQLTEKGQAIGAHAHTRTPPVPPSVAGTRPGDSGVRECVSEPAPVGFIDAYNEQITDRGDGGRLVN